MTYFVIVSTAVLTNIENLSGCVILSDDKQAKVIEAAREQFIRFGFRRTTMGDIAEAAGMSRPALYLVYANKEEIFRAVVRVHCDESVMAGRARIEEASGLEARIEAVLQVWVIEPYELVHRSPEAEELYESTHAFTADLRDRILSEMEQQLVDVMQEAPVLDAAYLKSRKLTVEEVARLLAWSGQGMKRLAGTVGELKKLLTTMVRVHVVVLTGGS